MSAPKLVKCRGLYTASNRYDVPEGALVQATNILIYKDGVIQPRWGLVPSATSMTNGNVANWHRSAELNGTLWFGGRDTVANTLSIGYASPTFAGVTVAQSSEDGPDPYSGFTATTTPFYDMEFIRAGNLLYYNCARGLIRIESSSTQRRAGNYPCAVSCMPRPLAIFDLSRSGSSTATATTYFAHGYVAGIKITISGSSNTAWFANGEYTIVSVPSATTFTYVDATDTGTRSGVTGTTTASNLVGSSGFMNTNDRVAYRAVITEYDTNGTEYVGEVSGRTVVTNASPFVGTASGKNVQLAIIYPPGLLASNTKIEVYRSRTAPSLEPADDMGLVYSKFLTANDVTNGYFWFTDINPDSQILKALYTNETQDGAFQNHQRPASAKTAALWKDRLVLASTFDFPQVNMQLLSVDSSSGGLTSGDTFVFRDINGSVSATFTATTNGYTTPGNFTVFSGGTASIDVKHTVLSLVDSINWAGSGSGSSVVSPLTSYNAVYTSTPTDWPGAFAVRLTIPNQREAPTPGSSPTLHAVVTNNGVTGRGMFAPKLGCTGNTSNSVKTRSANVTTITMSSAAHKFEVGEYIQLWSTLLSDSSTPVTIAGTAVEGVILTVSGATITISNAGADGSTASLIHSVRLKYNPELVNNHQINNLYASKPGALEAFCPENSIKIGSAAAKILKCVPCKDSLMVFKEDGLFRVVSSGAYGKVLSAELVDPNAILWAKDSAVAINGRVMAWLTKGVAIINEQGVEKYVSSQRIDDRLSPTTTATAEPDLLAYPYSRRAQAFVDEKHNLYELRICLSANPSAPYASTVNVIYNTHNDTWVEDDLAVVSEVFYLGKRYIAQGSTFYAQDNQVYAGLNTTQSAVAVTGSTTTADVYNYTNSGGTIPVGSYIIGDDGLSSIVLTSASGSGTVYAPGGSLAQLQVETGFTIYNSITSTIQYAPVTMGAENRLKRHKELQLMHGVREQLTCGISTYTELVTTAESNTVKLGAVGTSVGVNGYAPQNVRIGIPQQHRVAQQLSIKLSIYTGYGAWTILGLGVLADVLEPRINR